MESIDRGLRDQVRNADIYLVLGIAIGPRSMKGKPDLSPTLYDKPRGRQTKITGEHIQIDTSSRRLRERFARIEAEGRARVARELRRLAVEHVVLSTDGDWLKDLGRRLQ